MEHIQVSKLVGSCSRHAHLTVKIRQFGDLQPIEIPSLSSSEIFEFLTLQRQTEPTQAISLGVSSVLLNLAIIGTPNDCVIV
jgi:hypothetical protein